MFETQNGWTKDKMKAHIKLEFKGKSYEMLPSNTFVCKRETPRCLYRGPDGKKCAAGMFITDEAYNKSMDKGSQSINKLMTDSDVIKNMMPLDWTGMNELQRIHDHSNPDNTLEDMLRWVDENVRDASEKR